MSKPAIGQSVTIRGMDCTIRVIHSCGTIDVESSDGRWFRVSGLQF